MGGLTGKFAPKAKTVFVWPPPSADGDGEEFKVKNEDTGEWVTKEDPNGKPMRRHELPEGFQMKESRDEHGFVLHTYAVKTDERGQVERDRNGNALNLPEGGAAVIHGDGTFESIPPERLRDFLNSHEQV